MPLVSFSPKLQIHYLDPNSSANRAVLLLHGLGATGESWQLQFPDLITQGYRPIAPDSRGFGQTSFPGRYYGIKDMAADTAALLDHLEIEQANLVGISMGGTLAQQLTIDCPERVTSLMLVNTFACLRPDNLKLWWVMLLRMVMVHTIGIEKQAAWVAERLFPNPDEIELRSEFRSQVAQANPGGYRTAMRALARFDSRSHLANITTPTLIVTGDSDTTIPPRHQKILVENIPHAQQIVVPDAGHAVTVTHAVQFNQILLQWLARKEINITL